MFRAVMGVVSSCERSPALFEDRQTISGVHLVPTCARSSPTPARLPARRPQDPAPVEKSVFWSQVEATAETGSDAGRGGSSACSAHAATLALAVGGASEGRPLVVRVIGDTGRRCWCSGHRSSTRLCSPLVDMDDCPTMRRTRTAGPTVIVKTSDTRRRLAKVGSGL
jgi:hypothetical protein